MPALNAQDLQNINIEPDPGGMTEDELLKKTEPPDTGDDAIFVGQSFQTQPAQPDNDMTDQSVSDDHADANGGASVQESEGGDAKPDPIGTDDTTDMHPADFGMPGIEQESSDNQQTGQASIDAGPADAAVSAVAADGGTDQQDSSVQSALKDAIMSYMGEDMLHDSADFMGTSINVDGQDVSIESYCFGSGSEEGKEELGKAFADTISDKVDETGAESIEDLGSSGQDFVDLTTSILDAGGFETIEQCADALESTAAGSVFEDITDQTGTDALSRPDQEASIPTETYTAAENDIENSAQDMIDQTAPTGPDLESWAPQDLDTGDQRQDVTADQSAAVDMGMDMQASSAAVDNNAGMDALASQQQNDMDTQQPQQMDFGTGSPDPGAEGLKQLSDMTDAAQQAQQMANPDFQQDTSQPDNQQDVDTGTDAQGTEPKKSSDSKADARESGDVDVDSTEPVDAG